MPCDISEMLQRQFYFFGTYLLEEQTLECWEREARKAAVIVDVGANAGIFSLAALAARPDATVHAFEPTPEIASRLRETAALNGLLGLHVHEKAVSCQNGQAALRRYRGGSGANEGMNFTTSAVTGCTAEIVTTVSLDRFCEDQGIERIDLLKIDIQGNEHLALAGAAALLGAGRIGTVFTELNWAADPAACPASEAIRLLDQAGYAFSKAGPGGLRWRKAGSWMRTLGDVMARRVTDS